MNVFVINAGSSSLKFQVIATDLERIRHDQDDLLCRGQVERIGGEAIITVQNRAGSRQKLTAPIRDVSAALDYVLRWLASDGSGSRSRRKRSVMALRPTSADDIGMCRRRRHESDLPGLKRRATLLHPTANDAAPALPRSATNGQSNAE